MLHFRSLVRPNMWIGAADSSVSSLLFLARTGFTEHPCSAVQCSLPWTEGLSPYETFLLTSFFTQSRNQYALKENSPVIWPEFVHHRITMFLFLLNFTTEICSKWLLFKRPCFSQTVLSVLQIMDSNWRIARTLPELSKFFVAERSGVSRGIRSSEWIRI
jgi:hypothetical protein